MPLILGTNSIKDTGFDVANSLRFNDGSSDHLTRSLGASETSTQKGTFSFWVKRGQLTTAQMIYTNEVADDNNRGQILLEDDDTFMIRDTVSGSNTTLYATSQLFRDVSAWLHMVVALDSTQAGGNRIRVYKNGTRIPDAQFGTSTEPNQNSNFNILTGGQTNKNHIGKVHGGSNYFDGYLAEFVYCDGQVLDADSFGEFDEDTGIWKPIDVSGLTFGNNGFYLDFENSGSLGADVSGNSNNFTVNNLTSIDQTTDTCTNNFATWNPLASSSQATLSEGNLKAVGNSSDDGNVFCNMIPKSGKWYAEFKITKSNDGIPTIGIRQESSGFRLLNGTSGAVGYYQYEASVRPDGQRYTNNSTASWGGSTFITGSIVGIALDCDNGAGYISVNGTYMNSGDPTSGASKTGAFITWTEAQAEYGGQTFASRLYTTSSGIEANFGSPPYSESGGNSDGNGYGNFASSVPANYYCLNTKNLAEYG